MPNLLADLPAVPHDNVLDAVAVPLVTDVVVDAGDVVGELALLGQNERLGTALVVAREQSEGPVGLLLRVQT